MLYTFYQPSVPEWPEHRHLWVVHYLEFTRVINYEAPDDFRWVLSKGMKIIYILNSIVFPCIVPWVLKHNTNYQAKQFQLATYKRLNGLALLNLPHTYHLQWKLELSF